MATASNTVGSGAPHPSLDSNYCLKWNNHQVNIVKCFSNLLKNDRFVDVTLAADGKFLQAHRVILSSCSPYFEDLFLLRPENNPVVFLKDVSFQELQALLDFMYKGEVSITQDKLGSFLRTAESLQIRGLTQNQGPKNSLNNSLVTPVPHTSGKTTHKRRRESDENSDMHSFEDRLTRTHHDGLHNQGQTTLPPLKHRTMLTREESSAEARRKSQNVTSDNQSTSENVSLGVEGENIGHSEEWSDEDDPGVVKADEVLVPQLDLSECQGSWNNSDEVGESVGAGPSRMSVQPMQPGFGITGGLYSQEAKLLSIIGQFGPTGLPFPKLSSFSYRPECPPLDLCQSLPECSVYRQEHTNSPTNNHQMPHTPNGENVDGGIATLFPEQRAEGTVSVLKAEATRPANAPNENAQTYECTVCGRTYSLQRSLWRHAKYECRDKRKDFVCPLCGKTFMYRFRLARHISRGACLTT